MTWSHVSPAAQSWATGAAQSASYALVSPPAPAWGATTVSDAAFLAGDFEEDDFETGNEFTADTPPTLSWGDVAPASPNWSQRTPPPPSWATE